LRFEGVAGVASNGSVKFWVGGEALSTGGAGSGVLAAAEHG
jgi:hypothetical protein